MFRRATKVGLIVAVVSSVSGVTGYASATTSTSGATSHVPGKHAAVTVIAQGLNNPRGLAWGPLGALWVAEAGTGGKTCMPGPRGSQCFGLTGSVSRIDSGHAVRVFTGLVSTGAPDGSGSVGVDGLSQRDDGALYAIMAASPQQIPPGLPPALAQAAYQQIGQLLRLNRSNGDFQAIANVGAYDWAWADAHRGINPQYPDANPYGVLALEGGATYVVDAASNTLDRVGADGNVTIVALFPNPPVSDAVPTCVDRGEDGALYVGQLTGGGNAPGAASVWRVVPGQKPVKWQTGFTTITGCGFGKDGSFYVTEFQTAGLGAANPQGDVVKIAEDGTRTVLGNGQLFLPNGFLAGPDGSIYVSNWSVLPGKSSHGSPTGEVVRISG
jgi:sugar lactone lactonase YvrE